MFLLKAHQEEMFLSLRTVSEGGLAVSLAKACFGNYDRGIFGFEGDLLKFQQRRDSLLYGEAGGRVIVELDPAKRSDLIRFSMESKVQAKRLGSVTSSGVFEIKPFLSGKVDELFASWTETFR